MTAYPFYQVNAFTNSIFGGNPAAVCQLTSWLPTELMQQLAKENNLSETAFFVQDGDIFHIRWFTPEVEMDLAGHPTLATAFVIFNHFNYAKNEIEFHSKGGPLYVAKKENGLLEMNFPSRMPIATEVPKGLVEGFNVAPIAIYKSRDYVLVFNSQADIANLQADFSCLNQVDTLGIITTAIGDDCDFVSRFFVPNSVIGEDPVTGSAHATLIPFWADKLGKNTLHAKQISERCGVLYCESKGDRVTIAGECVLYIKGNYFLP